MSQRASNSVNFFIDKPAACLVYVSFERLNQLKQTFLAKTCAALGTMATFAGAFLASNSFVNTAAAADDKDAKVLYVYNWTEYIPTSLLKKFTKETGIEVRYSTYESNEEMYSKLKLVGGQGYDLIFPSTYYINLLKDEGLIQKLDKSKVDWSQVEPHLLGKAADPKNEYSVPYTYGFTVLGVNSDLVDKSKITSWADLWNPQYKNLVLLNDVLDVFSMVLLKNGVDPNAATDEQLEKAYADLKVLTKRVTQYNSDSPEVPYVDGTSGLGQVWTGSVIRARAEGAENIHAVFPKEGSILWIDNFAISAQARNPEGAYKFINFILRPENSLEIINEMGFQTASSGLKALLPKENQEDPLYYPSDEVWNKAILNNIPVERLGLYNNYWNQLKVE